MTKKLLLIDYQLDNIKDINLNAICPISIIIDDYKNIDNIFDYNQIGILLSDLITFNLSFSQN